MALPRLLVTDLDGTLLGDEIALARFAAWLAPRRRSFLLAYNSGRLYPSVCAVMRDCGLPPPDAVISGVGSEIRYRGQRLDTWPIETNHFDSAHVRAALADCQGLRLQPEEFQSARKVSYYGAALTVGELAAVRRRLEEAGQRVELVYSSNRDLDILPAGVDKGRAIVHLMAYTGLSASQVIVAGDTGNDRAMFHAGFRGIVVGNARDELKSLCGPDIYHAAAPFAAGVLEGLVHWCAAWPPGYSRVAGRSGATPTS